MGAGVGGKSDLIVEKPEKHCLGQVMKVNLNSVTHQ